MPLLVACRYQSRLMRHCFLGRWTCQLVKYIYIYIYIYIYRYIYIYIYIEIYIYIYIEREREREREIRIFECVCETSIMSRRSRKTKNDDLFKESLYGQLPLYLLKEIPVESAQPPSFVLLLYNSFFFLFVSFLFLPVLFFFFQYLSKPAVFLANLRNQFLLVSNSMQNYIWSCFYFS